MTGRTACVLARTTGTAPCSRCLDTVAVTASAWQAVEASHHHHVVCDACSQRDDPSGHASLLAWRRAARATRGGTRA